MMILLHNMFNQSSFATKIKEKTVNIINN